MSDSFCPYVPSYICHIVRRKFAKVTEKKLVGLYVYFYFKQMVIFRSIPARVVIAELTVCCATKIAVRLNLIVSTVELVAIVVYGNVTATWLPAT